MNRPSDAGPVDLRTVAVAIDAAGPAGGRPFSYHVPPELEPLDAGEAVLVEFGRRQALGIVLGPGPAQEPAAVGRATKPILDRVRSDGPLLPPLAIALADWIAEHYLAPAALVLRAMLPPGMLERLELVAERRPEADRTTLRPSIVEVALLDQLAAGPRPVRALVADEGRPALVRRLRAMASQGWIDLEWTLRTAASEPRFEPVVALTPAGVEAVTKLAAGPWTGGRRLGARQAELLEALADGATRAAVDLARRSGPGTSAVLAGLARRGFVAMERRPRPRRPLAERAVGERGGRPAGTDLTAAQTDALRRVTTAVEAHDPRPLLLDGVTGGGKTAVYVEAIEATLGVGRPALVLVPEIALALPLIDRLRAELDVRLAVLHSGLGDGERADEWRRIRAGDVDLVVGTRLAALAPLGDVGLIIVDEEHDAAYKSDRTPRFQARDTAVQLARLAGAAIVLGSATPAVESVGRAAAGEYHRIRLPSRPAGEAPSIEVVDLRAELASGNRGLLSSLLAREIGVLDVGAGDQAILVINRRGSASVVLCRDCGHVQACPDCTLPLVLHQAGQTLRCHHCGRAWPLATRCPACGSARIRYLGGGTERLEREVRDRFPRLRIGRLDRDIVARRGGAARVVDAFSAGRLDVLVGTSLVTKGFDIPSVTLVGVVSADIALNLPDERAAERTFQLLVQAIGRAGRGGRPGRAVIQTYLPDHPVLRAVADADQEAFYAAELADRRRFGSPPFGRSVKLTLALADRAAAEREADSFATTLRERSRAAGTGVTVSGPAPAYVARRGDRWRFHVILRGAAPTALLDGPPAPPWSVDVDPESLL